MSFWEFFWFVFVSFAFVAYLMAMFSIVLDLFRDRSVSGAMKALWLLALVLLPIITAIVYLVVRGDGMAERHAGEQREMRKAQEDYIRAVAGSSSGSASDELAEAKKLRDSGAITEEEYQTLKARH